MEIKKIQFFLKKNAINKTYVEYITIIFKPYI
jgi:hypothetical protein